MSNQRKRSINRIRDVANTIIPVHIIHGDGIIISRQPVKYIACLERASVKGILIRGCSTIGIYRHSSVALSKTKWIRCIRTEDYWRSRGNNGADLNRAVIKIPDGNCIASGNKPVKYIAALKASSTQ